MVAPTGSVVSPATILLAEDEEPVRRLLVELLRGAGYCVLAAGSGAEALALAAAHSAPIALLVTDVAMPLMNGAELARRLQATQSGARVLFISGYSQVGALDALAEQPGFQYLRKPFTPRGLLERVREILA